MLVLLGLAHAGSVTVMEGPRPEKDVLVAIAGRQGPFQSCFNGAADATVTLQIKIENDGLVSDARYGTSVTDVSLPRCLVSESLRMRTPKRAPDEPPTTFQWKVSMASLGEPVPDDKPAPGQFTVRGQTDTERVRSSLAGSEVQFNYCHKKELMRDPTVAGSLDVHFTVDAAGLVQTAEVFNSTMGNPRIEECVQSRVRALRYPPSTDGQPYLVAWPVTFAPKDP